MSKRLIICSCMFLLLLSVVVGCLPSYTLVVLTEGEGVVNPNGGTYLQGTSVTITATPKANWRFDSWIGATGTQPTISVVMDSNKTITAKFVRIQQYVNVNCTGQGQVVQTLMEDAKATYNQGAKVKLEAIPAQGWQFVEWQGDLTGSTNPVTIDITKTYNITAVFNNGQKDWNFLVYLDGDNNLESYGIGDMNEMEMVGSTSKVNVLVLIDRAPGYDTTNGNWTGTRLYRITKDATNSNNIVSELIADYGEKDMSNPVTLSDFITYCQTNYPASKTVLTLWDHGNGVYPKTNALDKSGVKPKSSDQSAPRGICWDDTTGTSAWDCLTTDEVAHALATARAATGQKIDVLNMDACLMQMLEVAYEWRNEISYLVGSEETVPGYGNDYKAVLNTLTANPTITPYNLADSLVNCYYNYYAANGTGKETYSAISMGSNFNTLITAFKTYATALKNTSDMAGVAEAWNSTTYFTNWENNDLYDFTSELLNYSTDNAVKNAATTLLQAIDLAVFNHKETQNFQGKAHGLAILIPSDDEWVNYDDANQYVSLKLSQDTDWDDFIKKFVTYMAGGTPTGLLHVEMTWGSGDCDLGIWEPDNEYYWVFEQYSPNGVFSEDNASGGPETWTINQTHDLGWYSPVVYSYSYSGIVNFAVVFDGQNYNVQVQAVPNNLVVAYDFNVTKVNGVPQLQYKTMIKPYTMPTK